MNYKLLAVDIDGTLTNNRKAITQTTREVLIGAQQRGLRIAIASGRPTFGIAPLADELELGRYGGYVLSYNGGKIADWTTRSVIYEQVLPDSIIEPLYRIACRQQVSILCYHQDCVVTETPDDPYVQRVSFINKMRIAADRPFLEAVCLPAHKCLIVGDPEKIIPVESVINERFGNEASAYRSEPYFLEVVPKGIDKARSLQILLAYLQISPEELIAFGDGYNDIDMIRFAGMGVAMGNAQEEVKRAARYVTASNEQDGVAVFVRKLYSDRKRYEL